VLPEQVFVQAMEVLPDLTSQEESMLKPWVDPHQLKQHQGTWYMSWTRSFIQFSELESLSVDMIRWLVT
jgi:hypothetical protein